MATYRPCEVMFMSNLNIKINECEAKVVKSSEKYISCLVFLLVTPVHTLLSWLQPLKNNN